MRIQGRDVLHALCDAEESRTRTSPLSGVPAGRIAELAVGKTDGRAVTAKLQRLEEAGLARRVYPTLPRWSSTARGREVERLCSSIEVARGGTFRPRNQVITDLRESLALAL